MKTLKVLFIPFYAALAYFIQGLTFSFVYKYAEIIFSGFKFWWLIWLPFAFVIGGTFFIGPVIASVSLNKNNKKLSLVLTTIVYLIINILAFYTGKNRFDDSFNIWWSVLSLLTLIALIIGVITMKRGEINK